MNFEIERLYARYEARLGGGDDEDTGVCSAPALTLYDTGRLAQSEAAGTAQRDQLADYENDH